MVGSTPTTTVPQTLARGVKPWRIAAASDATTSAQAPSFTPDAFPAVTVPPRTKRCGQPGQCRKVRLARMFVAVDDHGRATPGGNRHRNDFQRESSRRLRRKRPLLAAQGEGILVRARDAEAFGDVLAGLRHRIHAVLLPDQRIDEAPAERRIRELQVARECGIGFGHHVRRAAHAFHAAGNQEIRLAAANGARGSRDRVESGTTQPVDCRAWHRRRQACEQDRHAGDVAVVLARLVRTAVDDIVERTPVRSRIARHQRLERQCGEIVGTDTCKRAAVTPDRGPDGITDESVGHVGPLLQRQFESHILRPAAPRMQRAVSVRHRPTLRKVRSHAAGSRVSSQVVRVLSC